MQTPSSSRVASRYTQRRSAASAGEKHVADMLDALADVLKAAGESEVPSEHTKALKSQLDQLVQALPKEAREDFTQTMADGVKSGKTAGLLYFTAMANAAAQSAKKHREGAYTQQYEESPVLDKVFDAYLAVEETFGKIAKRVGGALSKAFDKIKGITSKHTDKATSSGGNTGSYADYVSRKKLEGGPLMPKDEWESRYKKSSYVGNPSGDSIYPVKVDHGYGEPLAGGTDVMRKLQNRLLVEQGREPRPESPRLAATKFQTPVMRGPYYNMGDGLVALVDAVSLEPQLKQDAKLRSHLKKIQDVVDSLHKHLEATYIWD